MIYFILNQNKKCTDNIFLEIGYITDGKFYDIAKISILIPRRLLFEDWRFFFSASSTRDKQQ